MTKELAALEKIGKTDVTYYRNGLECSYTIGDTDEFETIKIAIYALSILKEMLYFQFDDDAQTIYYKNGLHKRSWVFSDRSDYMIIKTTLCDED